MRSVNYVLCCLLFLNICVFGASAQLEVSANAIQSDLKKGETILTGNVIVIKDEDKLWADKVVIEINKKNQPLKYTATGNVRFYAKMPNKEVNGRAKKAMYDVQKDEYRLIDNAMVEESNKHNIIRGNLIVFNPTTEEASIKGSNQKPSVITFTMDNANE